MDNEVKKIFELYDSILSNKNLISEKLEHKKLIISEILTNPLPNMEVSHPFGEVRKKSVHKGVDLVASSGTKFYSPDDGIVLDAFFEGGNNPQCGGTLRIQHQDGYESAFCHVKELYVKKGEIVTKQQVLGLTGGGPNDPGRGNSEGPHLHYQVKKNGQPVDPMTHTGSLLDELQKNPIFLSLDDISKQKLLSSLKTAGVGAALVAGGIGAVKLVSTILSGLSKTPSNSVTSTTSTSTPTQRVNKTAEYVKNLIQTISPI